MWTAKQFLEPCVSVRIMLVVQATGLSLADHSPSVILFDTIQKRAVELAPDFSSEQKSALEKAFKSFDYDHKDISSEL